MASSSVLLALNSLSSDGMVRISTQQREQFGEVVGDYFTTSDGSDDDTSGSDDEMECGKYYFVVNLTTRTITHYTDNKETDDNDDNAEINFNKEGTCKCKCIK